jgi:hypothetical protein
VCSAGDKPAGAKVRRPVVWIAGRRETKALKPIDKVSLGEATSHRAVTTVNAMWPRKRVDPKAEPASVGRRQHGVPKSDRCGTLTSAGWKRQHGDKDTPSNWRSSPRPGAKSPEQGMSSRQGWKSGRVKVPAPSIACIRTVSISGVCGGNEAQ